MFSLHFENKWIVLRPIKWNIRVLSTQQISFLQHNGTNGCNGYHEQRQTNIEKCPKASKESFEEVPLITACLTYLGFYLLMLIGYVNQLIVRPNLENEQYRDVSRRI